jgi:hypothetical protein
MLPAILAPRTHTRELTHGENLDVLRNLEFDSEDISMVDLQINDDINIPIAGKNQYCLSDVGEELLDALSLHGTDEEENQVDIIQSHTNLESDSGFDVQLEIRSQR